MDSSEETDRSQIVSKSIQLLFEQEIYVFWRIKKVNILRANLSL